MISIKDTFLNLKEKNQKAFIPYVTAGDPDFELSKKIVKTLVACEVDIIELGVPFSDPIADGPTNQKASERALINNFSLDDVFRLVKELREDGVKTPIVLFTYLNPIFNIGFESFAKKAKLNGVSGSIILDLPPEESDEYIKAMTDNGLETIFLSSPTTSSERLALIQKYSSGFVYYVSRVGVTGAKTSISDTIEEEITKVKSIIKKPLAVGFGVSNPEQAKTLAKYGDGVVVGSSIVKIIENNHKNPEILLKELGNFVQTLRNATK